MMSSAEVSPIRILLIDDHVVVRSGLRMLIESRAGLSVVAEAQGRADGLAAAAREAPNLILLDLDLGSEDGLDMIQDLLAAAPRARVLVLTGLRDAMACRRALSLGAVGLVHKEKAGDVLIKAIEKVHAGEVWIDRATMADLVAELSRGRKGEAESPEAAKIRSLSARERQVIGLIGEGLSNKQIAERLFVSEITVRHHLTSIFSKLGVHDRLELLVYAFRRQLVPPPEPG